jgi:transcription elongation factor Elf1
MRTSINSFKVPVPLESLVERLKCAFCGNPKCKVVGRVEKNLSIQLVECRVCALVSTDHFPANEFLKIY